ncbi:hypothetical protein MASR1M60_31480 [Rhodocyclaceae bacterium]
MSDQAKQYQQLIARCWADEAFKQKLLADPAGTLKHEGIEVPVGVTLRVVENTEKDFTLVIPTRPKDLSDESLDGTVGGSCSPMPGRTGGCWTPFERHLETGGSGS